MLSYLSIFDKEAMDYAAYKALIAHLLVNGKTTGVDHSEAMLHYTKMNVQRMNRVEKTTVLHPDLLAAIENIKGAYNFLVITEGWCGDAAQIVPVIQKIATAAPDKFKLKFVLRDQNLPLIDAHLTNGGRAIPALLILDENINLLLPKWGPRPVVLKHLISDWKKEISDMAVISERLHAWYAKDKTQAIQTEFAELLKQLT
jgi:hypothetical protein